jgi:tetraacyldisaccharide 4'-kinase
MGEASPRPSLAGALLRIWTQRGFAAWLLRPVAWLYRSISALRRSLYQTGILRIARAPVPVIVVGNVIVGGAGKTPTVIALVKHLQAQGHAVGVVSRGYGRRSAQTLEVLPDALPADTGDEPLLIRRSTGAPVFVAQTRIGAVQALIAAHPRTTVVVCDDGLQHYGLYRDLEVCVFDDRGCGNGWLLPAGPLREAWPRQPLAQAGQADTRLLVLHTGSQPQFAGYRAHRHLGDHAVRSDGSQVALTSLAAPHGLPILALAAIAQPQAFFDMLTQQGVVLAKTLALPDHYDFNSWSRNEYGGYQLICTEKDAAKLWQKVPDALAVPLVQTMDADFWSAIDRQLSSGHGHKTS